MELGDFGYFEFTLRKKAYDQMIENEFKIYGTIIEVDSKNILIADSHDPDIQYLPARSRIIKFTKLPKPEVINSFSINL